MIDSFLKLLNTRINCLLTAAINDAILGKRVQKDNADDGQHYSNKKI